VAAGTSNWTANGIALLPGNNTISVRAFDSGGNFTAASIIVKYAGQVDFDADGKSDIVWQHTDGSTAIWLMNGTAMVDGAGLIGSDTGWSIKQ
jgi:hypothetical protein